jgi:hypothetical protein
MEPAERGAAEGNLFYQKLWELNETMEEVAQSFVDSNLGGAKVDREFAPLLAGLELAYGKIINLVAHKRRLPGLPGVMANRDVGWVLGIAGAKAPPELGGPPLSKQS